MSSITVYFPDVGELLQTAPVKHLSTIQAPRILSQQVDYDVAQISPTFSEAMEAVEEKLHSTRVKKCHFRRRWRRRHIILGF
jgi:hypothetical protein